MRETKKITLSALMSALSVALMTLGAVFETLDLTIAALASLCIAFVYIEIGFPYTWISWIVSSLLGFLMFPQSTVVVEFFLLFGVYPILKGYVERLPRRFWWCIKLPLFNVQFWLILAVVRFVLGLPVLEDGLWLNVALYLLANLTAVAYDGFLTVVVRLYLRKYRDKIRKLLK